MTIASLLHQQYSLTQIATRLKRSTSTISRELKRNTQDDCYAGQEAAYCGYLVWCGASFFEPALVT